MYGHIPNMDAMGMELNGPRYPSGPTIKALELLPSTAYPRPIGYHSVGFGDEKTHKSGTRLI